MVLTRRIMAMACLVTALGVAPAAQSNYWFRASDMWAYDAPERVSAPPASPVTAPAAPQPVAKAPLPTTPAPKTAVPDTPVTPAPEPAVSAPAVGHQPVPEPLPEPAVIAAPVRKPSPPVAAVQLDLEQLEQRLRATKAIGMFTKLELKGQVNDLVERFEAFHENEGSMSLSQLERQFDLLLMKVLTLLQEDDKPLHREIAAARPALWGTLSDPVRFAQYARS